MKEDDFTDEERVIFSILGAIRFDAEAVARVLRSRPLSKLEAGGLASLLEGKNRSDGIRLAIVGQGRNWRPPFEASAKYDRCIAIGEMMQTLLSQGLKWEQATIDTAEHFGVSEATVSRNNRTFGFIQELENE